MPRRRIGNDGDDAGVVDAFRGRGGIGSSVRRADRIFNTRFLVFSGSLTCVSEEESGMTLDRFA
jgi:hypothetical protein